MIAQYLRSFLIIFIVIINIFLPRYWLEMLCSFTEQLQALNISISNAGLQLQKINASNHRHANLQFHLLISFTVITFLFVGHTPHANNKWLL